MARIVWAPKALDDLDALLTYIANDAPMAARRFAEKLLARADLLADHPLMGGYVPEDDSRTYREVRQGSYRILYRFDAPTNTVYLLAIHHASRLLDTENLDH